MTEPADQARRALLTRLIAVLGGTAAVPGCEHTGRDTGALVVGSSATGVPFSFVDPWSNHLTGAMIDIVSAVASNAALPIDLQVLPFAALIPALLAHKIDLIAAALLRTREREKVVAFSDPVYAYGGGLVVRQEDQHQYPDLAALREMRVGVQVGTRFLEQVNAAGAAHILVYENLSDMLRDLSHRRIDAAYGDAPILTYQLRVGPRRGLKLATGFSSPGEEALCFVCRRGEPLLSTLNASITALRATELPTITHRWGLS